jgi:ribokinase
VSAPRPRVGVVGHVEWVDFALVQRMPVAGEIVTARDFFALAAGGGAVAAVQLRKLAGAALFATALGDDELGARAARELRDEHRLDLRAAARAGRAQRRAFTHLDADAERTITVLGERLVPHGSDALPWHELARLDGIYFTGGDAAAARAARRARVLVASARAHEPLLEAGVTPDALVASAMDEKERAGAAALRPPPRWLVLTDGRRGGRYEAAGGGGGSWPAVPPPGPPADAYGCGDSFAAGLTYGLAAGRKLPDALALGARCGAHCLTGRGPYAAQLADPD